VTAPAYFILDARRVPVRAADREAWAAWHETHRVECIVSTANLTAPGGRDTRVITFFHGIDQGRGEVFETTVFVSFGPTKTRGARTLEAAMEAHRAVVGESKRGRAAA
jgi:hypothetical protein